MTWSDVAVWTVAVTTTLAAVVWLCTAKLLLHAARRDWFLVGALLAVVAGGVGLAAMNWTVALARPVDAAPDPHLAGYLKVVQSARWALALFMTGWAALGAWVYTYHSRRITEAAAHPAPVPARAIDRRQTRRDYAKAFGDVVCGRDSCAAARC